MNKMSNLKEAIIYLSDLIEKIPKKPLTRLISATSPATIALSEDYS
jgi:hypothetical protein